MDSPAGTQAILLAAGTGHRMPPLPSSTVPKAFLPIALRPMLFYPLHALVRASFLAVTIIVDPIHLSTFETYCNSIFPADPLVTALSEAQLKVSFVPLPEHAGTADVLRDLHLTARDVIVLSTDFISDFSIRPLLAFHRTSNSTCTAAFTSRKTVAPPPTTKKKAPKPSKATKPSGSSADCYALVAPPSRLLGLLSTSDISAPGVPIPCSLTQRHSSLYLRSDLVDAHIYLLNTDTLKRVLKRCPAISSVKYDLVPYLARRQHHLSKVAREETWGVREQVAVNTFILGSQVYARRANTVEAYLAANLDLAAGAMDSVLAPREAAEAGAAGKKKSKKPVAKELPFAMSGERVSLTSDSRVAEGVTAGHRVSVKKSVIGDACKIAANAKINSCVIMPKVTLEEGVNLTSCVVCEGAEIGSGAVLKDCRVAKDVIVEEGVEASGRDFVPQLAVTNDDEFDHAFEFV